LSPNALSANLLGIRLTQLNDVQQTQLDQHPLLHPITATGAAVATVEPAFSPSGATDSC